MNLEKPWTPRAQAHVGLQAKHPQTNEDQTPVAAPPKHSPPVPADVPVMQPPPPMLSPPVMPPPAPLPFPNPWMLGMSMQPTQAFPAAGMGAPLLTLPEPVATPPQHGQGIVVPPPGPNLHLELPKASSSAGLVELAIGVTNHFHGLHAAIAQVAYNQHMALYSAQVVPKSTPPARVCIPNCVGYSQ